MPEQMTFWETKHKNKRLKSMGVICQVHLKNLGQLGDDGEHIYFPKDPKCAETHVKEIESSVGSAQAFGILSEIPTRELGVDVEVMIKEILGENMVETHGLNRIKSLSKKKPNTF